MPKSTTDQSKYFKYQLQFFLSLIHFYDSKIIALYNILGRNLY